MSRHRRALSIAVMLWFVAACNVAAPEPPAPAASPNAADQVPELGDASSLFEHVVERARRLASSDYTKPLSTLPPALRDLDYDAYRSIAFRPERALWHGDGRFAVQVVHPGFIYRDPVRIHEVRGDRITPIGFDPTQYRYQGVAAPVVGAVTSDVGHAGFRVYYPLHGDDGREEVAVFLGASYFRLVGNHHVHGLSARGLAVDIGLDRGEEFPAFREFWLVRPAPRATVLTFYALLDSPSVTGAYRFDLSSATDTTLAVEAMLFARRTLGKLGVAPLSSMFLYGADRVPSFDDVRPQVHDSDGLLMRTAAGEWIWRPLANGPGLQVTSLRDRTPRGFGLAQRDRAFENYLDLEAAYHRRPSAWVTLEDGDWGQGGVELLAIPATSEFADNIAAYWVPDELFRAGDERHYRYRLTTFDDRLDAQTLAQVERTRIGWAALPGQHDPPPRSMRQVIVDFSGGPLATLEDGRVPEAVLETTAGRVSDVMVLPLPDRSGWRASFRLAPDGGRPADMRLFLEADRLRLSETWSYVWYPDRIQ